VPHIAISLVVSTPTN